MVIGLVLLIAVGPEQLPSVIRRVGQAAAQVRSLTDGLRTEFMAGLNELERSADPKQWVSSDQVSPDSQRSTTSVSAPPLGPSDPADPSDPAESERPTDPTDPGDDADAEAPAPTASSPVPPSSWDWASAPSTSSTPSDRSSPAAIPASETTVDDDGSVDGRLRAEDSPAAEGPREGAA